MTRQDIEFYRFSQTLQRDRPVGRQLAVVLDQHHALHYYGDGGTVYAIASRLEHVWREVCLAMEEVGQIMLVDDDENEDVAVLVVRRRT
jgi:hypothetical protein